MDKTKITNAYIYILVYKSVYVNSIAISCKPIPQHNFVKYVLFCKKCLVMKKDLKHIYKIYPNY